MKQALGDSIIGSMPWLFSARRTHVHCGPSYAILLLGLYKEELPLPYVDSIGTDLLSPKQYSITIPLIWTGTHLCVRLILKSNRSFPKEHGISCERCTTCFESEYIITSCYYRLAQYLIDSQAILIHQIMPTGFALRILR